MLYYQEPYRKEVEVKILKREGNRYLLSDTILYPGGGGQPADRGYAICSNGKFEMRHMGNLWHEIGGDCRDEKIKIILDWEYRYYLMRSHTAEHAFFRILENRGARMGKVALGEISSIIFDGDVSLEDIMEAERKVRNMIKEGRKVRAFWIDKKEVRNYPQLRIKIERIKDNRIRIVEIEDHDLSACKGVHVRNLSEIEDFCVVGVRLGKKKEVKFIVGEMAREKHFEYSQKLRKLMWERNQSMDSIESYIGNLERENVELNEFAKRISNVVDFQIEQCGELKIYSLYLPFGDYKVLQRRAMEIANQEDAVIFYGLGEKSVVCVAYNSRYQWVKDEFLKLLRMRGGRGGGKGNFVSGSDRDPESFVEEAKKIICNKLIQLDGGENGSH